MRYPLLAVGAVHVWQNKHKGGIVCLMILKQEEPSSHVPLQVITMSRS